MAFLIITESVDETIKFLENAIVIEQRKYTASGSEVDKATVQNLKDKLQAAVRYQKFQDRLTQYGKIKHFRTMNPERYAEECAKIVKGLKGVYFVKDRGVFRVQITRLKKKLYLGCFDTPDDALEVLQKYI